MSESRSKNSSSLTDRQPVASKHERKKPYKIVLESVTQEKKRLHSVISYNAVPPAGYTFVPIGIPEVTDFCKELSRERGVDVFVVTTSPRNRGSSKSEAISQHVHRVGHHFRNDIVERACAWRGYRHDRHGRIEKDPGGLLGSTALARTLDSHGKRLGLSGQDDSQQKRSEQVRETIKELFPRIPDQDLDNIVLRAFEEGTGRVGNADLPLPRKVQLAVVAHIRHNYTDYDALLKIVSWHDARSMVERDCLDQIVKWRGEDDQGATELEDIFREVIVIDDDDEEPSTEDSSDADRDNRESSIEIVASRTRPADLDRDVPSPSNQQDIDRHRPPQLIHVQPLRISQQAPVLRLQEQNRRYNLAKARNGIAVTPQTTAYSQGPAVMDLTEIEYTGQEPNSSFTLPLRGQVTSVSDQVYHNHGRENHAISTPHARTQHELRSTASDATFSPRARLDEDRGPARISSAGRPFYVPEIERERFMGPDADTRERSDRRPGGEAVYESVESTDRHNYALDLNRTLRGTKRKSFPIAFRERTSSEQATGQYSGQKRQKMSIYEGNSFHVNNGQSDGALGRQAGITSVSSGDAQASLNQPQVIDLTSSPNLSRQAPPRPRPRLSGYDDDAESGRRSILERNRAATDWRGQGGLWPQGEAAAAPRVLYTATEHYTPPQAPGASGLWDARRFRGAFDYYPNQLARQEQHYADVNRSEPTATLFDRHGAPYAGRQPLQGLARPSQDLSRSPYERSLDEYSSNRTTSGPAVLSTTGGPQVDGGYGYWRVDTQRRALTRGWSNAPPHH